MFSSPARSRRIWPFGLIAVIALVVGLWFGGHPGWLPSPLRSVFVSQTTSERRVQQVLDLISRDYYRKVNTRGLVSVGLEAAVASLHDPYSHYIPPSGYKSFENETNPRDSGIGIYVNVANPPKNGLGVTGVIPKSPAAQAGLVTGDVITAVGPTSLKGHTSKFDAYLIQGRAGTPVQLTVQTAHGPRRVRLMRANITVPQADSRLLHTHGLKVGYLAYAGFTQGSAGQLKAQLQKMLHQGAQGLILDLRDNGGGLLEEAIKVASLFIRDGTIVTTRGRSQPTIVYTALGHPLAPSIPMVVLVNRDTASSAEIVTGALKDRGRAEVVGTNTYGKGVFQEIQNLPGGGALDITVGEYFTPNGQNLGGGGVTEGRGIRPNVYVPANSRSPGRTLQVAERVLAAKIR
ncbi:MAG TPA: S41 family peptidase [Solirubrobacteraceae bacterium]|jgi:carboxyl-terminal processing protease|nr:S41 family peptidase [Solirubrobacteraceae bacterium]